MQWRQTDGTKQDLNKEIENDIHKGQTDGNGQKQKDKKKEPKKKRILEKGK